jgi:hypothetical protein
MLGDMHSRLASRTDFSLVAGGPTHWLQERLGLIRPGSPNLARRAALSVLLTWVPLLVLSGLQGLAIGDHVRLPFLYDFAAYTRFLIAIPLLILAEGLIERRVAEVVTHFVHAGLLPESSLPAYEAALDRGRRLRDSTLAEVVLVGLAALSVVIVRHEFPFDFSTWRSLVSDSGHARTWAGWWYLVIGVGLFQFLIWRWLWRLFIWYGFLWRVSKLDLRLIPTHPDGAAGLGFVGETQRFFWSIVFAFSATTAGVLANEIVYAGVPLKTYWIPLAGYVVVVLLVFLGPLLTFMPRMIEAKITSLHDYSALAVTHNRMFDGKWVQGDNPKGEPVLGTPEISSLADLGNAYDVLDRMRPVPFDPADAVVLVLAALIPMTPLLLTVMPLGRLLEFMSKFLV